MIPKAIEAITEGDLQSLISSGVLEGRTIEYKQVLPGTGDSEKKEFLADISSFANSAGGDLLYGIAASDGLPIELVGLSGFNSDQDLLRLENLLRDSIQPRIPGVRFRAIEGAAAGPVLLIRVPRSWAAPHMVAFRGGSRFFGRNSAGKFQMDVTEIRSAFTLSEDLPERIGRWRADRIGKIAAGDTPVRLAEGAKLVLHIVPLDSFAKPYRIEAAELDGKSIEFGPMAVGSWNHRINLDGYLTHGGKPYDGADNADRSYCQVFRSGRIEAVSADLVAEHKGRKLIGSAWYEKTLLEATAKYLNSLTGVGVTYPTVVLISFVGADGATMAIEGRDFWRDLHPIDRSIIQFPEILLDEPPRNLPRLFRPVFDAAWNASGVARSLNYDEAGRWVAGRLREVPAEEVERPAAERHGDAS